MKVRLKYLDMSGIWNDRGRTGSNHVIGVREGAD